MDCPQTVNQRIVDTGMTYWTFCYYRLSVKFQVNKSK